MENHNYCGKCVFCNSRCPGCESTDVNVRFNASFEYINDEPDRIGFSRFDAVELDCNECGEAFVSTQYERDERLDGLWRALESALNSPDGLEIEWADGEVSYHSYKTRGGDTCQ